MVHPSLPVVLSILILVGGLEHSFIFQYIWDNPSHWLLYFSGRSKPPTSITIINNHILGIIIPSDFHFFRGVGIPPTSYQLTIYIFFFHPSPVVFGVFDRRGFFHATDQVLGTKRNGFSVSLARSEKISSCRGDVWSYGDGSSYLWNYCILLGKNHPDKTNFDLGYLGVGYTWTYRVSTHNQAAKWGFTWVYHDLPSKISEQTTAGIEGAPWCIIRFVWKWAEITWNYHHQCIAMFVKWWMPCFQTNPGGVTTGQLAIGI